MDWVPLVPALGLPAAVALGAWGRMRSKRAARDRFVDHFRRRLLAHGVKDWVASRDPWSPERFTWKGRLYTIVIDPNPLFSRRLNVRLGTFADSVLEFDFAEAAHVAGGKSVALASVPEFRRLALRTPAPEEATAWLLAVKEKLAPAFPRRWGSLSRWHCEVALAGLRPMHDEWEDAEVLEDLDALGAAAAVPGWRDPKGGTWTLRRGWEPNPMAWHWPAERRARLPEGVQRWGVSAWCDNAYLNRGLADFFGRLGGELHWVTGREEFQFLEAGFGIAARPVDRMIRLPGDAAVAADQYLDGEFFSLALGFDAAEGAARAREILRGASKGELFDRALRLLPEARFVARRLFDDEFSWFSGEYEILSAKLTDEEVKGALAGAAQARSAAVKEIDRPFSFKLLRDDRLEVTF